MIALNHVDDAYVGAIALRAGVALELHRCMRLLPLVPAALHIGLSVTLRPPDMTALEWRDSMDKADAVGLAVWKAFGDLYGPDAYLSSGQGMRGDWFTL